jgi:hypothetical protein
MFENRTRTTTVEVIFWNFCQLAGIVYYLIIRLVIFSAIFFSRTRRQCVHVAGVATGV